MRPRRGREIAIGSPVLTPPKIVGPIHVSASSKL
jgi:hypothetical protein